MKNEILDNIFGILSIAIAIATFLPALVYSYTRGFVNDIEDKKIANKDFRSNIFSFAYSIDLIVTQSVIMVAFTAFSNLFLYLGKQYNNSKYLLLIVMILWIIYFVISLISFFSSLSIRRNTERWDRGFGLLLGVFVAVFVYNISEIIFSTLLLIQESNLICTHVTIMLIMVTISIIFLIFSAVSWIIPLGVFNPLRNKIDIIP